MSKPTEPELPENAGEMVRLAREFLQRRGIDEWRLEAELLVAHALGLDRLRLFMALDKPVTAAEVARARELLVRRGKREPTAYILGEREFYGRMFAVGPGVLVPRPETELMLDRAREIAEKKPIARAFDWGTGSGCIAITLALEIAGVHVDAVDASPAALAFARRNLERHATSAQRGSTALVPLGGSGASPVPTATNFRPLDVALHEGDAFECLARFAREHGAYDLIVANPPYIPPADRATLAPEVRDHEPAAALFAPERDPDHALRRLFDEGLGSLASGGTLLVELGHDQAVRARALAAARGLEVRVQKDLGGHERVLELGPR